MEASTSTKATERRRATKHCDVCKKTINSSSFATHLRSKAHLVNLASGASEVPKLKQLTETYLNKKIGANLTRRETASRMLNPYYITGYLNKIYEIQLMEHHPQHLNSLVRITPTPLVRVLQIDPSINRVVEQLSKIYSKLINQTNFKYHVIFNVKFDKEDEHVDYFINLPISNKQQHTLKDNV